jgi:hypothetical protein
MHRICCRRPKLAAVQERPGRRRYRSRRPRGQPRPTEAAASARPQRAPHQPVERRPARSRDRRPQRDRDDLRPGAPCIVLLDCREGAPDRTGEAAVFEGFFDLESGEPRRSPNGVPRLRVADDRLWGFECWWRPDPARTGLTAADREQLETSKRLLRGLLRDARRGGLRAVPART